MFLGIDFGTSNSSAQLKTGGAVRDVFESDIPTLFMYNPEVDDNLFGKECQQSLYAIEHSDQIVRHIKSTMRFHPEDIDKPIIQSGGKSFTPREVTKLFLKDLIEKAKKASKTYINDDVIEKICITAPVSSDNSTTLSTEYRKMLVEILEEITGLPKSRIYVSSEPIAGAVHYLSLGQNNMTEEQSEKTILVVDLGGGTLDVALVGYSVSYDSASGKFIPSFNERTSDGDTDLGGTLWDKALAKLVLRKMGINSEAPGFIGTEQFDFMLNVELCKISLSSREKTTISAMINNKPYACYITVEEFEEETKDLLNRVMRVVEKVVEKHGGIEMIDKIILTGGASNMPQIKKGLYNLFPEFDKEKVLSHEPSKAIAKGAALFCDLPQGKSTGGIKMNLVSGKTYGFRSMNSKKTPPRDMIYNVIFKDDPFENGKITVQCPSSFVAVEDDQSMVSFVCFESEALKDELEDGRWMDFGPGQKENGVVATIRIPEKYIGKASQYLLFPKMTLGSSGILSLDIYDEKGKLLDMVDDTE